MSEDPAFGRNYRGERPYRDEELPLRKPFFAPRLGKFTIPDTSILAPVTYCLKVNVKWLPHVLGVLTALDQPDAWQGTPSQIDNARNEIRLLKASIAPCDDECSGGTTMCLPVGMIAPFGRILPPESGWLLCDGTQYVADQYPELVEWIESCQAAGEWWFYNGDFFATPDLTYPRGIVGADDDHRAGSWGGAETVTLTEDQIPAHVHTGVTAQGNAKTYRAFNAAGTSMTPGQGPGYSGSTYAEHTDTNWYNRNHDHDFETDSTGGGLPFDILPPHMRQYYHIRAVSCTPCLPVPILSETGDLSFDLDCDGNPDTTPVNLKGEQGDPGLPGECPDCGDQPPPPVVDYPDVPPEYETPPPDIPCSAATRMASVLKDSIDELYDEAENSISIAVFFLKVVGLLIGGLFTGLGIQYLQTLWGLVQDNVEFDQDFWDRVKCEAYCLLPPDGLFDENIVTALWQRLADVADEEDDLRFLVISGFIRVVQYNGINYLERVEPDPDADCSLCDCYVCEDANSLRYQWDLVGTTPSGWVSTNEPPTYHPEVTHGIATRTPNNYWLLYAGSSFRVYSVEYTLPAPSNINKLGMVGHWGTTNTNGMQVAVKVDGVWTSKGTSEDAAPANRDRTHTFSFDEVACVEAVRFTMYGVQPQLRVTSINQDA